MNEYRAKAATALFLCQQTGDAAYLTDAECRILDANENCRYILGFGPESLRGKTVDDLWNLGIFDRSMFRLGYNSISVRELFSELNEYLDLEKCDVKNAPRITPYAIQQKMTVTGITRLANNGKYVLYICVPLLDTAENVAVAVVIVRDLTDIMHLRTKIGRLTTDLNYMKQQQFDESFIGTSVPISRVKYLITQAASSSATILITGETGTGKEVVAREIYNKSDRRNKPYIRINCSAIPESLFESELFGYEKGAFTGALNTRKIGLLEMADGGTVLLDEIEDLPLAMQAKLLRVLQEREIRRIGGNEVVKIDIRVIATTNKDLLKMVNEGKFRRDFYYRLNVISISLPLLRERRQDIVALSGTFLNRFNEKYKKNKFFELEALARLESYEWPGNVRDLEHTIERLVVIGDQMEITADDVESAIHGERVSPEKEVGNLQDMLDAYERTILENAVNKYGSSRKIAKALGISQPTVLRKLKRLHII